MPEDESLPKHQQRRREERSSPLSLPITLSPWVIYNPSSPTSCEGDLSGRPELFISCRGMIYPKLEVFPDVSRKDIRRPHRETISLYNNILLIEDLTVRERLGKRDNLSLSEVLRIDWKWSELAADSLVQIRPFDLWFFSPFLWIVPWRFIKYAIAMRFSHLKVQGRLNYRPQPRVVPDLVRKTIANRKPSFRRG